MPDWLTGLLVSTLGSMLGTTASATCIWILKKAFSKTLAWRWVLISTVVSFILVGTSFLIYQQANSNGDPDQVTPIAHQNVTPNASDNSDNPTPSKANLEDLQPTPTQTPKPTPVPTSTPIHTPTPEPTATLTPMPDPTQTPIPIPTPTATPVPAPATPPAPTLALAPTIRPDGRILLVVIDRNPRLAEPLDVQALSALVTGANGLSVEIHNAVCNNTEHINTEEWVQLHCGYYEETQKQSVIEHLIAWHESVGYLRCDTDGIPNSLTMEFRCFAE